MSLATFSKPRRSGKGGQATQTQTEEAAEYSCTQEGRDKHTEGDGRDLLLCLSQSKKFPIFLLHLHLNISDIQQPAPSVTSEAHLDTRCLGCERLSFPHRSKGRCWDTFPSPGQQGSCCRVGLWWAGDLQVRVGSAPQCEVNFSFFFFTFHESSQRKRKFVPRLFVYSMYTFSSPDGLRSSGL